MKKLCILLPLATMLLVSLAVPIPSNNSSTVGQSLPTYYDRRYQLFDAILAYKNALLANEIITSTENVGSILKDYSQWLRRHNTINRKKSQLFQDLKENLENFTETIEIFRNDSNNCQLQRKVQTQLYAVDQVVGELNSKPINQIWDKHYVRYTDEVENYDFELLATHVQSFLRSLNEAEVTENKELLAWCQEFLTTREPEEKRVAFKLIRSLYDEELQLETKAGQPNCQLLAQIEWKRNWKELRLQMYANQLNALEKQIKEAQALKKSLQRVIDLYKHEDKAFVRGLLLFGLLH